MKGDKGVCSAGESPNVIRRTKFNTEENCKVAYQSHVSIGVIPTNYVIYKCKACDTWHFGKKEWANLYQK